MQSYNKPIHTVNSTWLRGEKRVHKLTILWHTYMYVCSIKEFNIAILGLIN